MSAVTLSLVSHTNVGKTALARTLLGRDIGEVRDAPHVTEFAEMHRLLKSAPGSAAPAVPRRDSSSPAEPDPLECADGDELLLWDTPGFGDSVRLARRLRGSDSPLAAFLAQIWDRWRDRAFWASQQALRHVRDESDVVLYLVNAAEPPESAAYVAPEMELLAWVGKPVIVLLNQMGAPRAAADEAAEVERWRRHLAPHALVRAVLPLDAFARCWVHEGVLLDAVRAALGGDERVARLRQAWAAQRLATFEAAVQELAASLARIAGARVEIEGRGWVADRLLGPRKADADAARAQLAAHLDAEVRASTGRLLALHGIEGAAGGEILERVATLVDVHERVDEGRAALVGGVVTGALAGLKADIASGGLTMGGGLLAGGILGALGAAGVARGLNIVRGTETAYATWRADAMLPFAEAALLRYLAVAHFGRGRGAWREGEAPTHWRTVVGEALAPGRDALLAGGEGRAAALEAAAQRALQALYPGAWPTLQRTASV